MKNNVVDFDEGKVAQMSATFAITIFLSLTLLFAKRDPEYDLIEKLLWTASGFFCAASMRLLDRIFDHDKDFEVILTFLKLKGRSLISSDQRWMDGRFTFYFVGWFFFLSAFFYVGIMIFSGIAPSSIGDYFSLLISNVWLGSVSGVMVVVTVFSVTRDFLFIN